MWLFLAGFVTGAVSLAVLAVIVALLVICLLHSGQEKKTTTPHSSLNPSKVRN
jgi:hypothetical protein